MNFGIEFICTDMRPLLSSNQKLLLNYLRPLHSSNRVIVNEPAQKIYYKHLGLLNTDKYDSRTTFNSRNFLRLPQFEKYRLTIRNCNYDIIRGPKIERSFVSEVYGVINRLSLEFDFRIKYPKLQIAESEYRKSVPGKSDGQKTFELIKFLSRLQVHVKKGKNHFPLYELGDKMADIISVSTVPYKKPDKPANGSEPAPNAKQEVIYTEKVCVFICKKDELTAFPGSMNTFYLDHCPKGIEIKYFNFQIKSRTDAIRVFFIIHNGSFSPDYLKRLRSVVMDLWVYYWSLEKIISKNDETRFKNGRIDNFLKDIQQKISSLNNNKRFNFVNLMDQDCGEIMCFEKRKRIQEQIEEMRNVAVSL